MSIRAYVLAVATVVIAASVAWWSFAPSDSPITVSAETVKVEYREFSTIVTAIGAVKPQVGAEVRVGSRISGRLQHLHANIGHTVEKGQILAELESSDLQAIVSRHEAAVAVAQAKIADAQAHMRLANSAYERQQNLFTNDATSQQFLEEAMREKDSAIAGLQIALGEHDLVQAELDHARANLSYATILAPISGVVASVATQEGETVAAGFDAPTFVVILDLSRLQVNTYVDEVDIGKIKISQRVLFSIDAYPERDFSGHVSAIYPTATIQDNVVRYVVVVDVEDDHEGLLRPEMTASVHIQLEARKVLAVPTRSIRQKEGRSVVYILNDNRPEIRSVRVGWRDGAWAEIVDGLTVGERVLLDIPATPG